jgi:CHAT domain-containing protein
MHCALSLAIVLLLSFSIPAQAQSSDLRAAEQRAQEAYYSEDYRHARALAGQTAQAIKAQVGDDHDGLQTQLGIMAASSEQLRDYATAERHYRDLLSLFERKYGRDTINSAFGMEALARVLLKNGRVREAEDLYSRVVSARKIMLVSGIDPFKARHQQNHAHVALATGDWKRAYAGFRAAFKTLTAGDTPPPVQSQDYLADLLSGEMNATNFLGLARAAWHLGKLPGENPDALLSETFEIIQLKWRTAAADALMKAAQRRRDASVGGQLDTEERQRQLMAEQEDTMQSWFAKRDEDPQFRELWARFMAANKAMSPERALGGYKEDMELSNRLMATSQRCTPHLTPACRKEMADIQAKINARQKERAAQLQPIQELQRLVEERERQLPGYAEYQRRHTELQVEISKLSSTASVPGQAKSRPARPAPTGYSETGSLSTSQVQSLLEPGEALVTYLVNDEDAYVWVITRKQSRWMPVALDGETATDRVAALRCGLDATAWYDANRARRCRELLGVTYGDDEARAGKPLPFDLMRAHDLYRQLFGELGAGLEGKRLIIVSSGALASLPFSVLVTESPQEALPSSIAGYRDAAWLGTRQAITILPSVASLKALRSSPRPSQAREPFIGWGDPTLQGTPDCPPVVLPSACPGAEANRRAPSTRERSARFAGAGSKLRTGTTDVETLRAACPLPDTAHELRCVARSVGGSEAAIHLRADANEAAIKSAPLDQYRIVHFATHGLLARETGQFSSGLAEPALLLTPPARATRLDNGLLTASEIAQLKLDADWVVLSACNTAAAGGLETEMLSGLARGFFYAGARSVLVSHWAVDSDAAVHLTSRMFAELSSAPQVDRGEALRRSMAALVRDRAPYEAHPSYWAPFVIVGEGRR